MTDEQKPEVLEVQQIPKEVWEAIIAAEKSREGGLPTYAEILAAKQLPAEELEFKKAEGIDALVAQAFADIKDRSFSGRNPELGKMIKCQVCTRRHRASQVCVQKFKYLWTEEEIETGIKNDVHAEHKIGKSLVKGRRKRQRPNHSHLEVVEIAKDIYGRDKEYDAQTPEHRSLLAEVRVEAIREWKRRRRVAAKQRRKQQDVSRRINRGLLVGGFRP